MILINLTEDGYLTLNSLFKITLKFMKYYWGSIVAGGLLDTT